MFRMFKTNILIYLRANICINTNIENLEKLRLYLYQFWHQENQYPLNLIGNLYTKEENKSRINNNKKEKHIQNISLPEDGF